MIVNQLIWLLFRCQSSVLMSGSLSSGSWDVVVSRHRAGTKLLIHRPQSYEITLPGHLVRPISVIRLSEGRAKICLASSQEMTKAVVAVYR